MAAHQNQGDMGINGGHGVNGAHVNGDAGINGGHGLNGDNGINGAHGTNGTRADNGAIGGNDSLQLQPSTSDSAGLPSVSRLRSMCLRGLSLCRELLYRLARRFSALPLGYHTLDIIYTALTAAERTTVAVGEVASGSEIYPRTWYIVMPLSVIMMVATTGSELAEKYLDIHMPSNQRLVEWLNDLRAKVKHLQEEAAYIENKMLLRQLGTTSYPALEPARSPSSTTSSLSDNEEHLTEEEPAEMDTPGDQSMYFSVEKVGEETKAGVKDDGQKAEEKAEEASEDKEQKPEAKDELSVATAEAVDETAASIDQPQPQPKPQPEAPPAAAAVSAVEAALSALPPPPAEPPSSQDFLAAEGSSRPQSGTSKRSLRSTSKAKKSRLTLNLF